MTNTVCTHCGEPIAADAKFCEQCGTKQERQEGPIRAAMPKLPGEATPLERLDAIAPGTGDLASQLATQLRTPTVAMALVGGALAAAATFAVGLVLSLLLSDQSLAGSVDQGKGLITSGLAQMLNFLQVGYGNGVGKLGPACFIIFPIAACGVAAATQARRTLGLGPLTRLLSGAGVGVVFGLLMLVPALGAGGLGGGASTTEPDVLGAVLLGVLFGVIGGLLGTYYIMRTAIDREQLAGIAPPVVRQAARIIYVAVRPLMLLLVVMTLVGTGIWTIETLLKSDLREGRSTTVATVDAALYGVEHGVHWAELSSLAEFRVLGEVASSDAVPVPVGNPGKIKVDKSGNYRLFGFSRAMPIYTFAPLLIFMLGGALLLALSAGFAVTQSQQPATPRMAAAWGSLVGPIWAVTMVIVNALVTKYPFGRAIGSSVFGWFLIGGLIMGAVGGLVATQAQRRRTPASTSDGQPSATTLQAPQTGAGTE
jgi:hypothetical protein